MYLLIQTAIILAHERGKTHRNLAAVPSLPAWPRNLPFLKARIDCGGLRQFKGAFATSLCPLYAAAPGPLSLTITLADIMAQVQCPSALANINIAHNELEDYEFAPNYQK
jgi:hypothetical protein